MHRILVFVSLVILFTNAYEHSCTYTSKAGQFYDFSPLSICDLSGYSISSPDGRFQINICNDVQSCGTTGVCQDGQFNCGSAADAVFDESGPNVRLTYNGGDKCQPEVIRKSIFTFICDKSVTVPSITYVSEMPQCTYNFEIRSKEACPKPVAPQQQLCVVNVFLVPHTHDDVGWLMTVEGYYLSQVKNILDTSVASLVANPQRKFIYVEQAYFNLWWNDPETSDEQRNAVKTLVKNGQWEFVIGAWVMPDEACTTYGAIIDQMTLGHQFLLNNFGVTPTKGWQIDPFGASSVTPVLEKLSGFNAHLIDRITNKGIYQTSQRLEFLWQGSPSLGKEGEIFTEIMGGGYCDWLQAFDFHNDPVTPKNVAVYGQNFANMVNSRTVWYKTPNVLAQWGCDFAFQNATAMFHSMDLVVDWLQENAQQIRLNVSYATLSEYYDSVWAANPVLPNVDEGGDYFPYLGYLWWTGYYTSRVELKGWVRVGEAVQRTNELLYSLGRVLYPINSDAAFSQLYPLRVANGYAQHHDGVSGTSVPAVVLMFQNYIIDGINSAFKAGSQIASQMIYNNKGPVPSLTAGTDDITNINNGETVALLLFNSLGWTRTEVVKVPVNRTDLLVVDSSNNKIPFQISPAVGGNITSKYHLFFAAKVGPVGFQTVFVSAPAFTDRTIPTVETIEITAESGDYVIANSFLSVNISSSTRRISSITNKKSGVTINVDQNLLQYTSKSSGAYSFGPAGPAFPISSVPPTTTVTIGPVVTEITQVFPSPKGSFAKQTIRLYTAGGVEDVENFVEIVFDIGPLPSSTEVITLFSTNINTDGIITTDDNGFEFLKREYQWGPGIEANYYPLVYAAYINDIFSQLTVISERSHGVSSQTNGALEVMIHRNPDMGDGFGPSLTDTTEVYPALRVLVDSAAGAMPSLHRQPYLLNFPLSVFTGSATSSSSWSNTYLTSGALLTSDLPSNVHLLSISALNASSSAAILRLTHLYASEEDSIGSKPVQVDLTKLFAGLSIKKLTETTLSANKDLGNAGFVVNLTPKQIHSFLVEF